MHEASLYEKREGSVVGCRLCAHGCVVAPGRRGVCGVRENRAGTLYTLTYGRLISSAVDPIEKKPLHHFLPGTRSYSIAAVGCNFRCDFCQNWQISQAARESGELPGEDWTPVEVAEAAAKRRCASVAYTYTEPTIFFEFARDVAREAHARGIANVFVTNGFQSPETVQAMAGLVDAANVDLKAFTEDFYRRHCGARLAPVTESIRLMHGAGIHVEVTTLLIPGRNDSAEEVRRLAEFLASVSPDLAWHVSRFHPDYKALDLPHTPMESLERAVRAGRAAGLRHVFVGNVGGGDSDTVCPACGALVIRRAGFSAEAVTLRASEAGGASCAKCGAALPIVTSWKPTSGKPTSPRPA